MFLSMVCVGGMCGCGRPLVADTSATPARVVLGTRCGGFPPVPTDQPQQVVWMKVGDVLHHCSYSSVNGWLPLSPNNPLTSDNAGPPGADTATGERRDAQVQGVKHPMWSVTGSPPTRPTPDSFHLFVRVSRRLPAQDTTLRTIGCGTEGDNQMNFWEFPVGAAVDKTGLPTAPPPDGMIALP